MKKIRRKIGAFLLVFTLIFTMVAPTMAYAWGGATHLTLIDFAVDILERDMGTTITGDVNYQRLKSYYSIIKNAADDPDTATDDVLMEILGENSVWASHFYNAYTGQTYAGSVSNAPNGTPQIHALYQLKKYMDMAVTEWKQGRYESSAYCLGYASHFMADLNNPHHAALKTVFDAPYNHGDFETYVDSNLSKFRIYSVTSTPSLITSIYSSTITGHEDMNDFLSDTANDYGKVAYQYYYSDACIANGQGTRWDNAAYPTMANAQRALALTIYRFVKEVGIADKAVKININTADELYAGTDDDVFFGMETSDGRRKEIVLDALTYASQDIDQVNDFEQDTTASYYYYFNDPSFDFSKVTKVWLRKDPLLTTAGDDWKLGRIDIDVNGQTVYSNTANTWLKSGSATCNLSIPTGGLTKAAGTAIGSGSVTIKTASDTWSGTDNDVYFGMILKNGMKLEFKCDAANINDFEIGDLRTYSFYIADTHYQPEQIDKFYLRKYNDLLDGATEDSWKVEAMSVKMYGKTIYGKNLNVWLEGSDDYTYSWYSGALTSSSSAMGLFDAVISTSSDLFSGTDDNVYFGMQFADGSTIEFLCDKSGYNDFEGGDIDTYTFCSPYKRQDVRYIWLRKVATTTSSGDDWKAYSVSIKLDGTTVHTKTMNTWLKGGSNIKYQWSVTGI